MSDITLNWQKTTFRTILVLFIITSTICLVSTYNYLTLRYSIIDKAKKKASEQTKQAAKEIDDFLKFLPPIVNSLADDISSGKIAKEDILKKVQSKAEDVTGIGVAFVPFGYDKNKKLFAPYYVERDGKEQLVQLEKIYDYTGPNNQRYNQTLKSGPSYLEPFLDKGSNSIVAEYAAPFFDTNKKPLGVAFANHSTTHIQNVIQNLSLGTTGYGFVISKNGTFVAHPIKEYAQNLKTISQLAKETHSPQLELMAKDAASGKSGYIDYTDKSTNQDAWMFFEPIKENGWSMVGVFIKDELNLNTDDLRHKRIHIALSLIYSLMMLTFLLFRIYNPSVTRLWICSIISTLLTLIGIIFMWHIAYSSITEKMQSTDATIIRDRTSLNRFLETATQELALEQNLPTNIDTTHDIVSDDPDLINSIKKRLNNVMNSIEQSKKDLAWATAPQTNPTPSEKNSKDTASLLIAVTQKIDPLIKEIKKSETTLTQSMGITPQTVIPATTTAQTNTTAQQDMPHMANMPGMNSIHGAHTMHAMHGMHGMSAHHHEGHMHIPTGLYMHHLEFKGATAVNIIAHTWQREAKNVLQKQIKPGIIFPTGDVKTSPAYEFEDPKWKVTGWSVQGNIDQPFKFDTYPFDTKLVAIQMWPNDFDKEVILVVDLDSYKVINPTALPGINPFIKIDGWQIEQSFFSYKLNRYFTNFGFYIDGPFGAIDKSTKSKTPELYFNVILRRHIFSSLMLSLFPIIVVLIILFIQLFTMAKQIVEDVSKVLAATIPLFFTVIAAHTQFKNAVPVQQIIFFEYFYFLLYFLIVVVLLFTFTNYWYKGIPATFYENLFLPLIAYWPFVTTVIFILTLIYFY